MHWFESQIIQLVALADQYADHRIARNSESAGFDHETAAHRRAFVAALNRIVENVAMHAGVLGCLISVDGLVMAMSGEALDFDALAAVTQECVESATKGAKILNLGEVQQMVVVGAAHKMAIVAIGGLALCVLSPRSTNLSASLREST